MNRFARLDHRHLWHPFTQMQDWLRQEPIVIARGQGSILEDVNGRRYLDANASIWTNLHGHNHPTLNRALRGQLRRIAHCSALGLTNQPAPLLAAALVRAANPQLPAGTSPASPSSRLDKVFFSDDGSTAMEVALKLAHQFTQRTRQTRRPRFITLAGAYHGDTLGAVSLGHIDLFHKPYAGLLFPTDTVPAPYCYRCPFNRAQPARADARDYRQCHWQCVDRVARQFQRRHCRAGPYAAFVFEPLIQGAAGMIPQPPGWLEQVTRIARSHHALLIADEILTGLGRASTGRNLFACHQERVHPDFMALAKGLTGGYLPLAATLVTRDVFDAFLGDYDQFQTFFHGHSYTANPLGCATALASLQLLNQTPSRRDRARLQSSLRHALANLWSLPNVGDIRQVGLIAAIELVKDWRTRQPFPLSQQAGIRVCQAMAKRGVLTRPIGNVVPLIPPYCTTPSQLDRMVQTLAQAIDEVLGGENKHPTPSTQRPAPNAQRSTLPRPMPTAQRGTANVQSRRDCVK